MARMEDAPKGLLIFRNAKAMKKARAIHRKKQLERLLASVASRCCRDNVMDHARLTRTFEAASILFGLHKGT